MQTTPNFQQRIATSHFFRSWLEAQPPGRVFRANKAADNPLEVWLNDIHPDYFHVVEPGFLRVRRLSDGRMAAHEMALIELPDWACDFDLAFQFEIVDKVTGTATAREILNLWRDV